jgi:hypothetical protein
MDTSEELSLVYLNFKEIEDEPEPEEEFDIIQPRERNLLEESDFLRNYQERMKFDKLTIKNSEKLLNAELLRVGRFRRAEEELDDKAEMVRRDLTWGEKLRLQRPMELDFSMYEDKKLDFSYEQ